MNLELNYPWVLLALPLSLLPWWFHAQGSVLYSSYRLLPSDSVSSMLGVALRVVGSLLIAVLIFAVSGPYRPALEVERIGRGAQMVLLLDRSRSMDQPYFSQDTTPVPMLAMPVRESKGAVARRMLSEFVAKRKNDMFGMVVFSSSSIEILTLTQKQEAIQASIRAGNIGKGLAETDIGAGLLSALRYFTNRPYTGSRIVVLVSDGAATLNESTRNAIKNLMRRNRVALYWIDIRSRHGAGLFEDSDRQSEQQPSPQRALHDFFMDAEIPYRPYTAENPSELKRAIADVSRLQNLPMKYKESIPRRDLSSVFFFVALGLLILMLLAQFLEIRRWQR